MKKKMKILRMMSVMARDSKVTLNSRRALIFIEQEGGKIKVSWRVVAGLDVVDAIAAMARPDIPGVRWTTPDQWHANSAWGDLYGAVDIWCPLFSLHRHRVAAVAQ